MANGGMMRIGRIVSYVVATCSFQALLACDPIEYASVVEIVPKTCDFWRYAGEVRSASEAADPKEVVKWSKDCGEPEEHLWRRLQFSQGSARFSIDTDVISKPDPDTISNLGSRVQFNMKGCDGKVESTAIEAIHRPLEADISNVAYLEYTLEGVNADWTVNVNRFSLASFQFDFISTTADEAFGDRLARATIGAADGSEGVFSASLCGKTFDPYKWKLEFFTSDLEIRRAIVGMVVTKAIRDDRRDGPSGEEVPSQCRATFLALSIGLPLLLSVLGATVLLLLLRRRRRRATTMPLEGVDVEEQTQTAILASLKAGRIETPHPNRSQDNGGGTGLSGKRGTAIAPWEAALDSHGNADRKGATAHAKAETLETASPESVSRSLRKGKGHEAPRSPKKAAWEMELEAQETSALALSAANHTNLNLPPPSPSGPQPPAPHPAFGPMHSPSRFRPGADRGGPSRWYSGGSPIGTRGGTSQATHVGWRRGGSPVNLGRSSLS